MWSIKLSREAENFYHKKRESFLQERLKKAIDELQIEMIWGPHIKKLRGKLEGLYRKDVLDYRIIYGLDSGNKAIYVVTIGHRGGVYR